MPDDHEPITAGSLFEIAQAGRPCKNIAEVGGLIVASALIGQRMRGSAVKIRSLLLGAMFLGMFAGGHQATAALWQNIYHVDGNTLVGSIHFPNNTTEQASCLPLPTANCGGLSFSFDHPITGSGVDDFYYFDDDNNNIGSTFTAGWSINTSNWILEELALTVTNSFGEALQVTNPNAPTIATTGSTFQIQYSGVFPLGSLEAFEFRPVGEIPIPAALLLFLSALAGLGFLKKSNG